MGEEDKGPQEDAAQQEGQEEAQEPQEATPSEITTTPKQPAESQEQITITKILQGVNLTPEQQTQLQKIIQQSENPDEDPKVLQAVLDQLEAWGLKPKDIHRKSLKIKGEVDERVADINERITQGKMPTENYSSNVGIYGYESDITDEGITYKKGGIAIRAANKVENLLRKGNDNEGKVTAFLGKGTRKRGSIQEVGQNIKNLGLEGFTVGEDSITESTDDIRSGLFLDDLLRLQAEHPFLQQFDKEQAIKLAMGIVADIHQKSGKGIGELLGNDIVIGVEDGEMTKARLTIPDIIYSEKIDELVQKATDIIDFLFSIGSAGMQTEGEEGAKRNIKAALSEYDDENVRLIIGELLEQEHPFKRMHNMVRFGFDRVENKKEAFDRIREIAKEELKAA